MTRHLYIPDTQVTPESDTQHIVWAAKYAIAKLPDVIIFAGDHWDMPSLCSYDEGKMAFEGRRYKADIEAGYVALKQFTDMVHAETARRVRRHLKRWGPRLIFTLGNHEYRIVRAVESDPKSEGLMSLDDLRLEELGFEVYPFKEPVVVDGIAYCHYFTSGVMGRPVSSARLMLNKKHMSCVMGHVQDRDIAYAKKADGTWITGLFAGIFYRNDQDYLDAQANGSWSGIWLLNDVNNGGFDELPISMKYLERKYG